MTVATYVLKHPKKILRESRGAWEFVDTDESIANASGLVGELTKVMVRTEEPWGHRIEGPRRGTFIGVSVPGRANQPTIESSTARLQHRLDNANRHFKWKAAEVFGDEDAIRLLARLYQSINIELEEFDTCQHGMALAKLTAANFCEIGAEVIYITEAGQRFVEALNRE